MKPNRKSNQTKNQSSKIKCNQIKSKIKCNQNHAELPQSKYPQIKTMQSFRNQNILKSKSCGASAFKKEKRKEEV